MELPNGITGYFDSLKNCPPEMNGTEFKKICNCAVLRKRGRMIDFIPPYYPANFYYAFLEVGGRSGLCFNEPPLSFPCICITG